MKKVLSIIVLILVVSSLYGQRERPQNLPKLDNQTAHFGYTLGLNTMDFTMRPTDAFLPGFDTVFSVEAGRFVGFNIGMISNLRLGNYFSFRFCPGMIFGQRNIHYKYAKNGEYKLHSMMIESTFLDFPMSIKYRAARINNWRPYLISGISPRLDMAAQKKVKPEERPKVRLKAFDTYYEIGVGADFFLEYFMFGIELKGSWGVFNNIVYDQTEFSEYFRRLNSRMLILSFHFEGGKIDKIKWWN